MGKDLFSQHAADYAKYRPGYPQAFVDYICSFPPGKELAWDCACGNGQASVMVARHFNKVIATDLSQQQIDAAKPHPRIEYSVAKAESSGLPSSCFDLVTVAQAYHWLKQELFWNEVKRVTKPRSIIAVWGYNLMTCANEKVTTLIHEFYYNVTDLYWEPERKILEDNYTSILFPCEEIEGHPEFKMEVTWNISQLDGYLNTWSAIKKFITINQSNPIVDLVKEIGKVWGSKDALEFHFPLALRLGRIQ